MKVYSRLVCALGLSVVGVAANAAAQFSEKDYILSAGDFNGDGRSDLLYVGRTPDKPNGIALADSSGAPQLGFQSWPATYLGIAWSTGQYVPAIGDFNGDGKSDIFMQSATAGASYVLLGQYEPGAGEHRADRRHQSRHQPDGPRYAVVRRSAQDSRRGFRRGCKDDVLLQAVAKGGTNAIVLTHSSGNLFTRNGQAIGCSAAGPQQCWTDGERGLNWSTKSANARGGQVQRGLARGHPVSATTEHRADRLRDPIPGARVQGKNFRHLSVADVAVRLRPYWERRTSSGAIRSWVVSGRP